MIRPAQISCKSWSHLQKAALEPAKEFSWAVGIRITSRGWLSKETRMLKQLFKNRGNIRDGRVEVELGKCRKGG
jgi:hypothetical protein